MIAQLFGIAVTVLILGWLWFYVARPILEDFGIIRPRESVNDYTTIAPNVMSRGDQNTARDLPSSLETDGRQTAPQTDRQPIGPQELLTLYRLLRSAGITREDARPVLKAVGLPLNNNLWTLAKPSEDETLTPIALRPTKAAFYEDDPDLVYQPPT